MGSQFIGNICSSVPFLGIGDVAMSWSFIGFSVHSRAFLGVG